MSGGEPRQPIPTRAAAPRFSLNNVHDQRLLREREFVHPHDFVHQQNPHDEMVEQDIRTKQALLTAIVVLVLFGAGFWLVQEFHRAIHVHECFEQGRRNCPAAEIKPR